MRIEELPSELLIYIFSFIRPQDLLQGWTKLNTHINSILRSTFISIRINDDEDWKNNFPALQYFSSQIVYLKDERLSPKNEIDLRSFENIRSIYLTDYSSKQCENINPQNHPYLTHCYCSPLSWSFYQRILFAQDRFLHLESIGCPRGGSILLLNSNPSPNPTIRHFRLTSASSEIISRFVRYLPHVISLNIDCLYNDTSTSVTPLNNRMIRHLTIGYTCLSCTDFDRFLSCIGYDNLIEVRLSFHTCHFEQLADILPKMSSLKRFQLRVYKIPSIFDLISNRLLSPWFTSLDYEDIIHNGQQQRILSMKTTSEQLD